MVGSKIYTHAVSRFYCHCLVANVAYFEKGAFGYAELEVAERVSSHWR